MTDKPERDIDRLFDNELLPLAARLKERGVRLLETRLESGATTYFVRRPKVSMAIADFEVGGCTSPDAVRTDLERLWAGGDDPSLATLARGMARLAGALWESEHESGDISNFIYVMY